MDGSILPRAHLWIPKGQGWTGTAAILLFNLAASAKYVRGSAFWAFFLSFHQDQRRALKTCLSTLGGPKKLEVREPNKKVYRKQLKLSPDCELDFPG